MAENLALEYPALDADDAIGGQRLGFGVIDVGAQRVERHATFAIPFNAGDFRTAKTATTGDLDAFGTQTQSRLHGALHGATEGNAADQLIGNALRHKLGVDFRLADFNNVQLDVALGQLGEQGAQLFNVRTLLADDDTGASRVDRNPAQLGRTLDHHLGHSRGRQRIENELADLEVFLKQLAVLTAFCVPAAVPGPVDLEAQADRIALVTHGSGLPSFGGYFANHDTQPAERLEDAGRFPASTRVETLHGDGLANAGFGNDQRVNIQIMVVFRIGDRRGENLARINRHGLLRKGQNVQRVFDTATTDQGGNQVQLLGGTTNGGANRKRLVVSDAAGGGLLTH